MDQIVTYIKKCRKLGLQDSEITAQLEESGWSASDIAHAYYLSEKNNQAFFLKKHINLLLLGVGVIFCLVVGFFAYQYLFFNPDQLVAAGINNLTKQNALSINIEGRYSDQLKTNDPSSQLGADLTLTFSTKSEVSRPSPNRVDFDASTNVSAKGEMLTVSFSSKNIRSGEDVFINLSDNPLNTVLGELSPRLMPNQQWIRLSNQDLDQVFFATATELIIAQLPFAMTDQQILKSSKKTGGEKVNNKNTTLIEAEIDSALLKKLLLDSIESRQYSSEFKNTLGELVSVMEIEHARFWISRRGKQIQQMTFSTKTPSILRNLLVKNDVAVRDATRMRQIEEIRSALGQYKNANEIYPQNLSLLVPNFLGAVPAPPTPADGPCTPQSNQYQYFQDNNGQDYLLVFCLGGKINELHKGAVEAGPERIQNISYEEESVVDKPAPLDISSLASLSLKYTFSAPSENPKISPPINYISLSESLTSGQQQYESLLELNQVKLIRAGLDSYFETEEVYPERLGNLLDEPGYLPDIPLANLTEGVCSGINSYYNYFPAAEGQDYTLEFCLTTRVENINAGKHRATRNRIE